MSCITINNKQEKIQNKLWSGYHFEVEKFLDQMADNPYLSELENDLSNQKKNKLNFYINKEILDLLGDDDVDIIYSKCMSDNILIDFIKDYNEKIKDEYKSYSLIQKKNELLKMVNNIELNIKSDINLEPTPLRISTMTACCSLYENIGTHIDTKLIYDKFYIDDSSYKDCSTSTKKYLSNARGIIGCKAESFPVKGTFEKEKKCTFFNSAALNVLVSDNKCINLKLFKNGKIQMTGVPNEDIGHYCVNIVIDYLKNIENTTKKSISDIKNIGIFNYNTVLINSDFFCGMELQRENLYTILLEKYDLNVSYEPENYPGVKLEYFWNKNNYQTNNEGKCLCSKKCQGKGSGEGEFQCKKITISSFQSGKVIVTGARSQYQLDIAYNFINKVFNDNCNFIKKRTKTNKEKIKSSIKLENTKFFFLKKSNIVNYSIYPNMIK
tara:strand:- start:5497 stop:6813 length:1317 start_codon:yes stop_codon:yes gene_type:complete